MPSSQLPVAVRAKLNQIYQIYSSNNHTEDVLNGKTWP